jgi:hypothetical protein
MDVIGQSEKLVGKVAQAISAQGTYYLPCSMPQGNRSRRLPLR